MKTQLMESLWATWARRLRRWGLAPWAGVVLEAGDPLFSAGVPVWEALQGVWASEGAQAWMRLLLDADARQRFIHWLQEGEA